jgi:hypothetical protein
MSRTKSGDRQNAEFWTDRPFNKHGGSFGRYAKKRTHKAERAEGKKQSTEGAIE